MSGSMYRRNVTLADLFSGNAQETQAPVAPTAAPPASLGGEMGMSNQERSRLLDILMQPEDVGPPPDIDEGTTSTRVGSDIGSAIADALGTYAAILGGGRAPDFMRQLQERRDIGKAVKQNYAQRKAGAETDAKRRTAQYLLGADDAKLQRQQDIEDKKAEAAEKAALAKVADENKLTDMAIKRGQEIADRRAKATEDAAVAAQKFEYDKVLAGIRSRDSENDPDAKHDKKALFGEKGVLSQIGSLAKAAQQVMSDQSVPPEQRMSTLAEMQSLVEQRIDEEGLSPEGEKAARAYYERKFGPIFKATETGQMNEDLSSGSPQQGNTFWNPIRALGRARSGG